MKHTFVKITCVLIASCAVIATAAAAVPSPRRDALSTSAINQEASHDITFTTATTIPASGTIVFTPQPGVFTVNTSLGYQDVDLLIDGVQQPVLASPGNGNGSAVGVTVISGSSGSVTITLNDTNAIISGQVVEVKIGNLATYGAAGTYGIINPGSVGSYFATIATFTSGAIALDSGKVGLAITVPVGINADWTSNVAATPTFNPTAGTYENSVSVSIQTTTPGASIYYTTDGSTPTTSSTLYGGPVTINQTLTLRAIASASGVGDSSVGSAAYTITNTSSGGGGGGTIPGYIPQEGEIYINGQSGGMASRNCGNGATLTLTVPPKAWDGPGYITISCLPFSTFLFKSGLPDQTEAVADTIFSVSVLNKQGRLINRTTLPLSASISYTAGQLAGFTDPFQLYIAAPESPWANITSMKTKAGAQTFTEAVFLPGLITVTGKASGIQCGIRKADLNCDNAVDLTDMSILLYFWHSTNRTKADINQDGMVNLIDFSILLYWWTGTKL